MSPLISPVPDADNSAPIPAGLDEALRLATAAGWAVFPVRPDGATYSNAAVAASLGVPVPPKGQGGHHFARSDEESIRAMWTAFPAAEIGIATGAASGIYVLDIDEKNGKSGSTSITEKGWQVPPTFWLNTKSGGQHHFFVIPRDGMQRFISNGDLGPGIDRKGDGGWVRWYGSAFGGSGSIPMIAPPAWMVTSEGRGGQGGRMPLGSEPGPNWATVQEALCSISSANLDERDDWRNVSMAFRQAAHGLAPDEESFFTYQLWCGGQNRPDEIEKMWRSADGGTNLGWSALKRLALKHGTQSDDLRARLEGLPDRPRLPVPAEGQGGVVERLAELDTHSDTANAFALKYVGEFIYNASTEQWLYWCGTHWQELLESEMLGAVRQFCVDGANPKHKKPRNVNYWTGVKKTLETMPEFSRRQEIFNRDNYQLNTPSGTFDLRIGQVFQHQPDHAITRIANAAPGPETGAWRKFVHEIMGGDVASVATLQAMAGASLSGAIEEHWLAFLYGDGRNGKSQFVEAITYALGSYATILPSAMLMTEKHGGNEHPTGLTGLAGARFAMSSEIREGSFFNPQVLKSLSGDEFIQARKMGGNWYEFRRQFKLWIVGNELPQLRTIDAAIRSRLIIVPFSVSFRGRENPDLAATLRADSAGVLNWLVEGHRAWIEAGKRIRLSGTIAAATEAYFGAQSTFDMWFEECARLVVPDVRPQMQKPTGAELYANYRRWKEGRGEVPLSMTRFGAWLTMKPGIEKFTSNGVRYSGVALRTPFDKE